MLLTILRNSLKGLNGKTPLGRWVIGKSAIQEDSTSNWASADHCGVCNDHVKLSKKNLTKMTKKRQQGAKKKLRVKDWHP